MYFRSVRFFLSLTFHACQKWIPKSLRSEGNKKLRAMIRNRPPLPPPPCKRFHATTFFRVSSFVCARLLRAPAHRKYAARGTSGWCRAGGCPMLVRNATFMLSILWTLADSTRSLLPRFFILHPFQTDYRLRGSTLDISLFRLTHFLSVIYYGRDENKIFHDIFFFFPWLLLVAI